MQEYNYQTGTEFTLKTINYFEMSIACCQGLINNNNRYMSFCKLFEGYGNHFSSNCTEHQGTSQSTDLAFSFNSYK